MFKLIPHDDGYRWYSLTSGYFGPVFKSEAEANKWLSDSLNSF